MTDDTRFRFERLDVWRKAIELASQVYVATREFPDTERFGLTSQMRRAAVSVSSNIAEGSGRSSDGDFARFIEIAYGSLMEVVSQAYLARQQGILADDEFVGLYSTADELGRMLSTFRTRLRK